MEIREATVVTRIFCGNDKCGRLKLRKFPLKFYSFFLREIIEFFKLLPLVDYFIETSILFFRLFIRATIFLTINQRRKFFSVILSFSRDSVPSFLSITSKKNRRGHGRYSWDLVLVCSFLHLFIYLLFCWWENSSTTKLGLDISLFDRVIRLMRLSMIDQRSLLSSNGILKSRNRQDTARERIERRKRRISLWL